MNEEEDIEYYKVMAFHEDASVRVAARRCLHYYGKPSWNSKGKRRILGDLSWALQSYIKRQRHTKEPLAPQSLKEPSQTPGGYPDPAQPSKPAPGPSAAQSQRTLEGI